jgi:GNAT superfamily N-acetyltransferase
MYIDAGGRGLGVGGAMLDRLLAEAKDTFGAKMICLDSARFMTGAERALHLPRFHRT